MTKAYDQILKRIAATDAIDDDYIDERWDKLTPEEQHLISDRRHGATMDRSAAAANAEALPPG